MADRESFTVSIDVTPAVFPRPSSMGTTRAAEWAERGTFEGPRIKGGSSQKHIFVGIAEKVPRANRIHYFMLL